MDDLKARIEAVLKGADVKYSKSRKKKVDEDDEMYKDNEDVYEQKSYPDDDDDEYDDDEFSYPSKKEAEKNHPDYKQDVALIRMMLNRKFKEKLTQLRGR